MKFTIATLLLTLTSTTLASPLKPRSTPTTISYEPRFDPPTGLLAETSCSDGDYGLIPQGYEHFSDLPNFPFIGGAPMIQWGSPQCGQCYRLDYAPPTGGSKSIYVTAIDAAPAGFNIALAALNELTDGRGQDAGRVQATYELVDRTLCGFPQAAKA